MDDVPFLKMSFGWSEDGIARVFWAMLINSAILALVAILEILFSNPLFATLGFEYSVLMALALSLICGIVGVRHNRIPGTVISNILNSILQSLMLSAVPLAVSILSLIFLRNCAFGDGLVFYLEIAVPSAIIGGLFGLAIGLIVTMRGWAIFVFVLFWGITLFLSLLPGYTNPQLFTYGWQYGFFPGFIWDASIELKNAYLISRLEQVVWAAFLFSVVAFRLHTKASLTHVAYLAGFFAISAILFFLHGAVGITSSHARVLRELSQRIEPLPNCTIYFAPGSLSHDELGQIGANVRWYMDDIERRFALSPPDQHINVYIYPSNKEMFRFIGTSVASIAKPWLSEVDIAKGHLESLKHELTHVLLKQKGVFPFYASWSTGVTEGAAMSVEPEYDGIYTLDEHAARILQLHYANGIQQVMSFNGFASNASQKSYVLAGSFARYLLRTYGAQPFDRVYSSLDWEKEYGKSLGSLEVEWKQWLQPLMTPMSAGDSAHFRYYYDRASIIFNPCLRRIGKLERKAAEAFEEHKFADADHMYGSAVTEGGGIELLAGRASALLREGNLNAAITVLDTTHSSIIQKESVALDEERADLRTIADDSRAGDSLYRNGFFTKLSGESFLAAYAHKMLLHSPMHSEWTHFLRQEYCSDPDSVSILEGFLQVWMHHHTEPGFDSMDFVLRYLYATLLERKGEIAGAFRLDPFGTSFIPQQTLSSSVLSADDSLAISLIAIHFAEIEILDPHGNYDISIAQEFSPVGYRNALIEMIRELEAESQFTNAAQRGPEMYP